MHTPRKLPMHGWLCWCNKYGNPYKVKRKNKRARKHPYMLVLFYLNVIFARFTASNIPSDPCKDKASRR